MAMPELDGKKTLIGSCEAYGETFSVEISPADQYPGYYHVTTICLADRFLDTTKKPILASGVEFVVRYYLKQHGLTINDMGWIEKDKPILAQFCNKST